MYLETRELVMTIVPRARELAEWQTSYVLCVFRGFKRTANTKIVPVIGQGRGWRVRARVQPWPGVARWDGENWILAGFDRAPSRIEIPSSVARKLERNLFFGEQDWTDELYSPTARSRPDCHDSLCKTPFCEASSVAFVGTEKFVSSSTPADIC